MATDLDHNSSSMYQSLFSKTISVRSCGITVSIRSDVLSCFIDFPQLLSLNTEPTDNTWGISLLSFMLPSYVATLRSHSSTIAGGVEFSKYHVQRLAQACCSGSDGALPGVTGRTTSP